jgi:hypothetical protein
MQRILIAIFLMGLPASAWTQVTGPNNPSGYAQTGTRGPAQPLSPYLNLLRGGNPAVNYFYGVRNNGFAGGFGSGGNFSGSPFGRFVPVPDTLSELPEDNRDPLKLGPTGHPTAFGNTLGYFGVTSGQIFARGAQRQSSAQPRQGFQPAATPRR